MPHLNLYIRTVRRVHSTFIFEFSVETTKLEVTLKLWDGMTEIAKICDGETGVL